VTDQPEIKLAIPASSRFVALTRVAAASLAAELDFSVDEIEEIRIAADELTTLIVEWAEDHGLPTVELRYVPANGSLRVEATAGGIRAAGQHERLELDEITRQILGGVVDDYEIGLGNGWILKHRVS
jgi:anti-sigma regulatory factor (Ser/Thr protein kinase)